MTDLLRRLSHAVVIGDQHPEVRSQLPSGRQMDGVEGPDPDREQRRCLVKDTVVDPDKIQPREHLTACGDWTYRQQYCRGDTMRYMKTMVDLDDEALALAAKELGTTTKKDTVNAALRFVAQRRRRIEQLLDDPHALGLGPDIGDPEIMRQARR